MSDIIALLLQHVFKYRAKVVQQNLAIAFPQKTAKERQAIANDFYQQFTDSFIETFKLISISDKNFADDLAAFCRGVQQVTKPSLQPALH